MLLQNKKISNANDVLLCIADINECNSLPCENGATCIDDVNAYNCSCVEGYNGTTCETGIFFITMMYFRCLLLSILIQLSNYCMVYS